MVDSQRIPNHPDPFMTMKHPVAPRPTPLADTAYFLRRWVRQPLLIGAVAPSGRALSDGMAAPVDPDRPGAVIELGGGTGNLTRSLLARGVAPGDLFPIEKDPEMHGRLSGRFPGVEVTLGDAAEIAGIARDLGLGPVKAVVSGLPLIGMPYEIRQRIVGGIFEILAPGGVFVQFTYTPVSPVHPSIMDGFGIEGRRVRHVWLNIPPARVWVYRRREDAAAGERAADAPLPQRAAAE
jgi:phosphatidylethanolamine/phosphatidyl-N-methylethanolamine N-methyltransferase